MPTSRIENITPIINLIQVLKPNSILEIGCGCGKYAALIREYLDTNIKGIVGMTENSTKIYAVEPFEKYITKYHREIYNSIFIGTIQEYLEEETETFKGMEIITRPQQVDLVLAVDVIEHLEMEEAINTINKLKSITKNIIMVVPAGELKQGTVYGNEHETHRSTWHEHNVKQLQPLKYWNINHSFIVLIAGHHDE